MAEVPIALHDITERSILVVSLAGHDHEQIEGALATLHATLDSLGMPHDRGIVLAGGVTLISLDDEQLAVIGLQRIDVRAPVVAAHDGGARIDTRIQP